MSRPKTGHEDLASLTIFQIKKGISDPDDIVVERENLCSYPVRVGGQPLGMLYLQRSQPTKPNWIPYFEEVVDLSGIRVQVASAGAVLLIERRSRLHAITFGHRCG